MTTLDKESLVEKLLDFLTVLHRCFSETTYVQDRPLYATDIAVAVGWLVRLREGALPNEVRADIVDSATTKHFADYWKQGTWGEIEVLALKMLQDEIGKMRM